MMTAWLGLRDPTSPASLVAGAVALLMFAAAAYGQQPVQPDHKLEPPANVLLGEQTLFAIRTRLGPFSQAERAAAASRKLARLMKDVLISPDAIVSEEHEASTGIVAGDLILITVTEGDAQAAQVGRAALAADYVRQMRTGVAKSRAEYTYRSLLFGVLYAALSTLVLIAVLIALRRFTPLLYQGIERWRGTRIRTVKIQSLELISAARMTELLIQSARLARIAVTLLLFYFYIPLLFSFFPWTRTFGATLLAYVFTPIGAAWRRHTLLPPQPADRAGGAGVRLLCYPHHAVPIPADTGT